MHGTHEPKAVLTTAEVAALLPALPPEPAVTERLLDGTGMRLMEGLQLRIKDGDFDRHVIRVRHNQAVEGGTPSPLDALATA